MLERIYRQSRYHQVRQRAHCLILATQGVKLEKLIIIFQVTYKTIYNWFERWELEGMRGLYNKRGKGRKSTFDSEQKSKIKEWTTQEPRQLKQVVKKVKDSWGIETSTKTIKRIIKTLKMSWHRMRRAVGGEPNLIEYKEKRAKIEEFKRLDDEGQIDLYYLDETGFCLIPSVPYGWQNIGEYLNIKSRHSRRLNVLGIMNRKNDLKTYTSFQSINSDVIIACIDAFFPTVDKPTVIVMDQSSIHRYQAKQRSCWYLVTDILMGLPLFFLVFQTLFGIWGRIPRLRRLARCCFESYPLSAAKTLTRLRGLPRFKVFNLTLSNKGNTCSLSLPLAAVVELERGIPLPSVSVWIRIPLPFPPYATSSPPPFPGGKRAVYSPKIPVYQSFLISDR